MKVLVTGGAGKAGRAVVADLLAHGHEVLSVDIVRLKQSPCPSLAVDLCDFGQTAEVMSQAEAVVHLAAIPSGGIKTDQETFRINMASTFNIFEAARILGMRKVVWASSETVLGLPFDVSPLYAPVDEAHPTAPNSTYSLSKLLSEQAAREYHRWRPEMDLIGLRFSNIMEEPDYARFAAWQSNPLMRKWNLWGYVDARDVAQSCRKALEARGVGAEEFIIAAADTCMKRDSRDLLAEVFPTTDPRNVQGRETCLSIEKARRMLGFEPEHTWLNYI